MKGYPRTCPVCQRGFIATHPSATFCGNQACRDRARRPRKGPRQPHPYLCQRCEAVGMTRAAKRRYCDDCAKIVQRQSDAERMSRRRKADAVR